MNTTFYGLTARQKIWVKQAAPKLGARFKAGSVAIDNLPSSATEILSIHTESHITPAVLANLPNLKLIITRTAGVDHIDLAACRRAKVAVANCAGLNATAVAEFAMGLLLSYLRRLPTALEQGRRLQFGSDQMTGLELAGKTLGVVGTGAIGSNLARIAKGFGMEVVGFDTHKNFSLVKQAGLRYIGLKQLFQRSDIISLHIPGTPLTERIINRTLLSQVKSGAVLLNTARGSIVDAKAVIKALDSGRLQAYLTDVLDKEQYLRHQPRELSPKARAVLKLQRELVSHPKVWVTPHVAHDTAEASQQILAHTLSLIELFGKGKKISTII
jgi:D-lactate dehydrogenase